MYDLGKQFHYEVSKLKANESSIMQGNKYRFTILTERLIRLEYSINGTFNDYKTELVENRLFDVPKFNIREDDAFLEITTKYFTLNYQKEMPFKGNSINPTKNLSVKINDSDNIWYYGHPEVRNYFGSNISVEAKNESSQNRGLYSLEGFVSFDDSNSLIFDENGTIIENTNRYIDIYLFAYNKDFGYALQDYFKLTGNPSLIPRYALGNWWCKSECYSDNDIYQLVENFNECNVPISVMLLDDKWRGMDENNKLLNYTFNKQLFSNPGEFINNLHQKGIRVGVNINPELDITKNEEMYNEAIKYIQPDKDGKIKFAPLNPRFIDVYFKLFIAKLESYGVDFFWNDYSNLSDLKSLWIMNHYFYLDLSKNISKRGMLMSRNPLVASHKYSVLYSGKTKVSWENFKKLPFFNISSANIGVTWWSHDICGYSGGVEEDDLYIRSVQLGVFSPVLRFHSKAGKYYKKEPWKWNYKTKSIVSDYLRFRHRLISYLYSEAYKYYLNGKIVFQPLYYLIPKLYDDILYRNEYFFGSELLVAPIISKKEPLMNRTIHKFFLPEGIWYDYTTGKKFPGNTKYVSFFKEESYPVFAKQGSIIPLSNKSNINNTSNPTELEIEVFPGKSNSFELYEDDGISSLYKEGYYLKTLIDYNYMPNNYTLIIRSVDGKKGIVPDFRNYKIRFRNTKKADEVVTYFNNGTEIENSSYVEGNDFVVIVNNVSTVGQLTINCKGKDIEIDAVRLINEDISSILMDLQIDTELKFKIDTILFGNDSIDKKRIAIRKLKKQKLDQSFIKLFLKLLEYIEQI